MDNSINRDLPFNFTICTPECFYAVFEALLNNPNPMIPKFHLNFKDILEPIPKPLSTAIGCKARGSVLSAKKVLNVLQHASEPFSPPALTTGFSLDLVTKQVWG